MIYERGTRKELINDTIYNSQKILAEELLPISRDILLCKRSYSSSVMRVSNTTSSEENVMDMDTWIHCLKRKIQRKLLLLGSSKNFKYFVVKFLSKYYGMRGSNLHVSLYYFN